MDVVIFLRDVFVRHPHAADVQVLLRRCDVYAVPPATNVGTAVGGHSIRCSPCGGRLPSGVRSMTVTGRGVGC